MVADGIVAVSRCVPEVDYGVPTEIGGTTVATTNEEAFARVLGLYARPGQVIVDPTFGHGRFWRNVDRSLFDLRATDLGTGGPDLRQLPYADETVDLVVLDPPYRYTPRTHRPHEADGNHGQVDGLYNLRAADLRTVADVEALYVAGFVEAKRVLRRGGFLIVKCQDQIESSIPRWSHLNLMREGEALGFACRDLLVVTPACVLKSRWAIVRSLRKAHSYFLVLRKGGHFPFGAPALQPRNTRDAALKQRHED